MKNHEDTKDHGSPNPTDGDRYTKDIYIIKYKCLDAL
jgi:hypothetical protein